MQIGPMCGARQSMVQQISMVVKKQGCVYPAWRASGTPPPSKPGERSIGKCLVIYVRGSRLGTPKKKRHGLRSRSTAPLHWEEPVKVVGHLVRMPPGHLPGEMFLAYWVKLIILTVLCNFFSWCRVRVVVWILHPAHSLESNSSFRYSEIKWTNV